MTQQARQIRNEIYTQLLNNNVSSDKAIRVAVETASQIKADRKEEKQ